MAGWTPSGATTGALTGAGLGAAGGFLGSAIGGGLGLLGGGLFGNSLFGGDEEGRRREELERARADAERRAAERYEKEKIDPELLKKQYAEKFQRSLQRQSGGLAAALSTQRGMNPALAAHLATSRSAELGAVGAGESAEAQTELDYQTQLYNNQLQNDIFGQEMGYAGSGLSYTSQGRQLAQERINNIIGSAATIGMSLYQSRNKGQTQEKAPQTSSKLSQYTNFGEMGNNPLYEGPYKANPFTPSNYNANPSFGMSTDYDHEPMHNALSSMYSDDYSDMINQYGMRGAA